MGKIYVYMYLVTYCLIYNFFPTMILLVVLKYLFKNVFWEISDYEESNKYIKLFLD